jgi:hypothetical protein
MSFARGEPGAVSGKVSQYQRMPAMDREKKNGYLWMKAGNGKTYRGHS